MERIVALTERVVEELRKDRNQRANTRRVLIVEDDANDVYLNKTPLLAMGFEVDIARSAEDALRMLKQSTDAKTPSYAIAFIDLKLGNGSGIPVIQYAKSITPELPIVVITGMEVGSQLIAEAVRIGYVGFIRKPLVRADTMEIMIKHRIPIPDLQGGILEMSSSHQAA